MTATINNTKKSLKKSVRFHGCASEERSEVSALHIVERVDETRLADFFYQPADVIRFREEVCAEKRVAKQISKLADEAAAVGVDKLMEQARKEMAAAGASSHMKITSATVLRVGIPLRLSQKRTFETFQEGRAQMA